MRAWRWTAEGKRTASHHARLLEILLYDGVDDGRDDQLHLVCVGGTCLVHVDRLLVRVLIELAELDLDEVYCLLVVLATCNYETLLLLFRCSTGCSNLCSRGNML